MIYKKLRYRDLKSEDKKHVCNGCGSKGGIVKPPNFLFLASCDIHDFYYWRGGVETDRSKADTDFYKYIKLDISNSIWYLKPLYHIIGYSYYKAVKLFGKKAFYYGEQKTEQNLIIEMKG